MSKKRSALERVRNSPKNATFRDLADSLELYGYELRRTSGDHYVYKKPGYRPITLSYCQNPVAIEIVKEVLRAINIIDEQSGTE